MFEGKGICLCESTTNSRGSLLTKINGKVERSPPQRFTCIPYSIARYRIFGDNVCELNIVVFNHLTVFLVFEYLNCFLIFTLRFNLLFLFFLGSIASAGTVSKP